MKNIYTQAVKDVISQIQRAGNVRRRPTPPFMAERDRRARSPARERRRRFVERHGLRY